MQVVKTFANKAATDLSGKDGYAVEYDSGMDVCDAITDLIVGIVTKGGDSTLLQSDVCIFGECKAKLGGTVTKGQRVQPHTDGTLVASAASSSTECGLALESGVAGDWCSQ
jgi:hypothetical protein